MTKNTVTFALGGRISVKELSEGISAFQRLVAALTGSSDVDWIVHDLSPGSAVATLLGEADDPAKVERIVQEYGHIGGLLERKERLPYSNRIVSAANAVENLAQSVEYVRLETPDDEFTVCGDGRASERTLAKSVGAITGTVQTLSNRGGLRFNLYDTVHDQAVGCYLQAGQEEIMREAWGRRARVSGLISRELSTGKPVVVRRILDVEILEDAAPGSYRLARGASCWSEDEKMPEEVIRQLREERSTTKPSSELATSGLIRVFWSPSSFTMESEGSPGT